MTARPHVAILGGGPAGLGAAHRLAARGDTTVTVIEAQDAVGGNAASFSWQGQQLDYGSHRLHPTTHPELLADLRGLLGDDLLDRPRHGRIRLRGRWIHFPLKPVDLFLRLDRGFAASALRDALLPRRAPGGEESFATVLMQGLGPTICREFYFPYARKIWGRAPEALSGIQARRRVSAGSVTKLIRKVLRAVPGFAPPGAGRFFYPRHGFGAIAQAYARSATAHGATLQLNTRLEGMTPPPAGGRWQLALATPTGRETLEVDYVWSTIPVTRLAQAMHGGVPEAVRQAAGALQYRAMILAYLTFDVERFTEFDAHYFPGEEVLLTRLSEPKNYSDLGVPAGRTTVCAEIPCDVGDATWQLDDAALATRMVEDLRRSGLTVARPPVAVATRRLSHAYPLYLRGYEGAFDTLDQWAEGVPALLSFGRQGLFAHDNTHHALLMGYRAADCLGATGFDAARWREHRREFATHVVED